MLHPLPALLLAASGAMLAPAVFAQSPGGSPTPGQPAYRSAFQGYQPFDEGKLLPWKESNDSVGKIGGWRAYAREAQQDKPQEASAPAAAAPVPAPAASAPHAGHGKP